MMIDPFTVNFDPVKFNLHALKLQPSTFWNSGYLQLLGNNGEERKIPLRELPTSSPIKWEIDVSATEVTVSITGYGIVCGEYDDETARSYSVTVSGPKEKVEQLQRSLLKDRGFTVVE